MDSNKSVKKATVSRRLFLYKSSNNYWHTSVITGVIIELLREIKYVSFECNSFLKSPRFIKGGLIISYTPV